MQRKTIHIPQLAVCPVQEIFFSLYFPFVFHEVKIYVLVFRLKVKPFDRLRAREKMERRNPGDRPATP